jgi:hypothetical protein
MPKPITSPKQLVVEGPDDRFFFIALLSNLKLSDVQIQEMKGKPNLASEVKALASKPGFHTVTALGVVRDSDENPTGAFKSVHDALEKAGLPAPNECLEICGESPRVAVILMPSAGEPGELEDLLLQSVAEDAAKPCVDGYFDCLSEQGVTAVRHENKRKVQVFIASRNCPSHVRLPGEAAAAGVWPWDSPAFDDVKRFLTSLFAEPES